MTEEFYETDPHRDFAREFAIQTVGPEPITFAKEISVAKSIWGWSLRQEMMEYNHWATWGLLGEILPWRDNAVTLDPVAKDRYGLPVAHVTFNLHENDQKLIEFGKNRVKEVMLSTPE